MVLGVTVGGVERWDFARPETAALGVGRLGGEAGACLVGLGDLAWTEEEV